MMPHAGQRIMPHAGQRMTPRAGQRIMPNAGQRMMAQAVQMPQEMRHMANRPLYSSVIRKKSKRNQETAIIVRHGAILPPIAHTDTQFKLLKPCYIFDEELIL